MSSEQNGPNGQRVVSEAIAVVRGLHEAWKARVTRGV
jgi:hypothetical protein